MKNVFVIFALIFTVSAFAQSSDSQQPSDTKAYIEQQVDVYTNQLNTTAAQDQQIDAIVDKRYKEYDNAKANVTDPKVLRDLRKSYLQTTLKDIKQVLTAKQWAVVEQEIDNKKNFSLN